MSLRVYNSASRSVEEFEPLDGANVRMYTCGPTVYDYAHIGNMRTFLFEDILRRYLRFCGYSVVQVMNLTDVEDKTIKASREAGESLQAYTQRFTDAFFEDIDTLAVERAEHYPAATNHIADMIDLIGRLVDKGFAYQSEDGSVYFSVAKFSGYGRLVKLDFDNMRPGERVDHDEYDKEVIADFALWKAWREDDGDVAWDSPWGRGRPGWHIECSAMSMRYLGETFDLHTGGVDNKFPHHEDEIAQSECATGKPFVKYWMHSNYLLVDNKKMSKSLGNFYTLRDLVGKGYAPRAIRLSLICAHYRQFLNFTLPALAQAQASLERLDEFVSRVQDAANGGPGTAPDWAVTGREAFVAAMDDDLNVPGALAAVFTMVHEGHAAMDRGDVDPGQAFAVLAVMQDIDRVLGVLVPIDEHPDENVMELVALRTTARSEKDWSEADRIRDAIAERGWAIKDSTDGPKLRKV